jgi:hypothetical protein
MAIVVEQEQKSRQGLVGLIIWGVVFAIIAIAVYYVFFKRPDLVDVATPTASDTAALSQIRLEPDEVINSPDFQALRSYVQPLEPQPGGRSNPFFR